MTREATEFNEVLAQYVPQSNRLYPLACRAYDVLAQVRDESDGHGITLVIRRDELPSRLDDFLLEHHDYNGVTHNLKDDTIVEVVGERRERDLGTVVNSAGNFVAAEVYFDVSLRSFREKYGVRPQDFPALLGYAPTEDAPGGRQRTALLASDEIGGSAVIITLGETRHDGRKGSIKAFYCGDRIYDDSGRKMDWDLAERKPVTRQAKVVPLRPEYEHHCGAGREYERAMAVGGPE